MGAFVQIQSTYLKDTQSILTKRVTRLILILIHQTMIWSYFGWLWKIQKGQLRIRGWIQQKSPTLMMRYIVNQLFLYTNMILYMILLYCRPYKQYTNFLPFVAYPPSIFLTEDKIRTSRYFQLCLMVLTYSSQYSSPIWWSKIKSEGRNYSIKR